MIPASVVKDYTDHLLRKGPETWDDVNPPMPPEVAWVIAMARQSCLDRDVAVRFLADFGIKEPGPLWPETSRALTEGVQLLQHQIRGHREWIAILGDADEIYSGVEVVQTISPCLPWKTRWKKAGGRIVRGRCIAGVDDVDWRMFSAYGHPFPPYDSDGILDLEAVMCGDELAGSLERRQTPKKRQVRRAIGVAKGRVEPVYDSRHITDNSGRVLFWTLLVVGVLLVFAIRS